MSEPAFGIGSEEEAQAALSVHDDADSGLLAAREGVFASWEWHRGGSRIAWRKPPSTIIYKIETAYHGSNDTEHRNARAAERDGSVMGS
jgi:hypothetical protein